MFHIEKYVTVQPRYRKVFFVSGAKRKSQKTRDIHVRDYAECIISVH